MVGAGLVGPWASPGVGVVAEPAELNCAVFPFSAQLSPRSLLLKFVSLLFKTFRQLE